MISTPDDRKQWTALHYAVDCNNVDLCRWLTSKEGQYRCDVNLLTGIGENVLHVIAQSNCIWANQSKNENPLRMIELLIKDCSADVNHADDEGRTPLHLAAMRGRRLYIKYLIYHGAKVDALTKVNASVLHYSVLPINPMNAEELLTLVKYIKKKSSKQSKDLLNLCTVDNMTPLVFVASHPAITRSSSNDKKEAQQKSKNSLMEIFTENVKDEEQIIIVFDVIARRKHHQEFDHLKCLLEVSSPENQEQLVHVACRHDNASLLEWLLNQQELKEHSVSTNQAEYTPLLTATVDTQRTDKEK
ncbi:unnamed protein product [Adineta steineri]|uniref:Uncharacterized protein n=1 Tax=Adineta steineri TaxID=433720 RepID=A0A819L7A0_9BILA|nr:unnamed protein product [Adineta steineri]